jgi:hypothetical protein
MLTNKFQSYRKSNIDVNENESMKNDIIIDSGASKSYFNSITRLSNVKSINNHVMFSDKSLLNVYGKGDFSALRDVSFAPNLRMSLISTKNLCLDNKFLVTFDKNKACIIDKHKYTPSHISKNAVITTATLNPHENLYHMDNIDDLVKYKSNNDNNEILTLNYTLNTLSDVYKATIYMLDPLEVLHVKFGHASEKTIKKLVKIT